MVDEIVNEQTVDTPQGNQVEPVKNKSVDYDSAIAAITAELNSVRQSSDAVRAKADKFDRVTEALTGETDKKVKAEKFFTDFANDPDNTLKQYVGDVSKSELSQLKNDLRDIKLKDYDTTYLRNLQENDPDFKFVWENMSKVITEKDWNEYKDKDNRTEITYGMAKARLAKAMNINKEEENKQIEQARNSANQTAVSAKPASGVEVKSEDEYTRRQNSLSEAKDKFDHEGVVKMLTSDIAAALGIK
jgi:hypothetical protein